LATVTASLCRRIPRPDASIARGVGGGYGHEPMIKESIVTTAEVEIPAGEFKARCLS
jgi:hypothetical protein